MIREYVSRFVHWLMGRDPEIDVWCYVCHLTITAPSSRIYQKVHEHLNTDQHKENEK